MDTNGNSPLSLADLLNVTSREPENPLARTLVDNYELDTAHKAMMVQDMKRLARRKSKQEQMSPRQLAAQMVQFSDDGKPILPEAEPMEDDDEDDGIRMHSDDVVNVYHQEGKMTPGKILAFAGAITAAGATAAAITWGLMKAGGPEAPPAVGLENSPGVFEKDVP